MPTPTYDLIEEKVLGSSTASVNFTSIPGTYKDLILEVVATCNGSEFRYTFNSDTGSNYSITNLQGSGTAAASNRQSNVAYIYGGQVSNTTLSTNFLQLMSYANTNVNKTALIRSNASDSFLHAIVGLWRSTAAVTSIQIGSSGGTYPSGSTFRLWGVAG